MAEQQLTLLVEVDFEGAGHERPSLCVNMTLSDTNPSDEDIASAVYEEVLEHLQKHPRRVPEQTRCDKTVDMFGGEP